MDLARRIIKELLKESVEQPKVEDAIRKHYEVMINYNADDEPVGRGQRIIQPTALGISKSGNMVVRAFQPNGDTKTRVPSWKLFKLENIEKWQSINRIFNEPKGFNREGDKGMSKVLLIAKFNGLSREEILKNIDFSNKKRKFRLNNKNKTISGNQQSINDMSRAKDFGDKNYTQTVGPIRKGDITNMVQDTVKDQLPNYQNAQQNGPVYKNKIDTNAEKEKDNINGREKISK